MNQFQEKKVVNFLKLSYLFEAHKNELSKDTNILRVVNVFIARLDSIRQELINYAVNSNEIATEIVLARSLVVKICNKVSAAIQKYAKENDFSLLKRNLYLDFFSLSDAELLDYSDLLLKEAQELPEIFVKNELPENEIRSLKNLVDNLAQIVKIPGMMFNFRAKTSDAFNDNIEENEKLISELDALLEHFENENFNKEYLRARNLIPAQS